MASYDYLTATGVIVPDTAATLEQVRAEYRAAFGADLDVSAETPQGVLITGETESRDAVARNNAALANQINPSIAGGVFLDAIWALMGGARRSASPSLLRSVTLAGVAFAIIPEGSRARVGSEGPIFALTSTVILDAAGNGAGDFQCIAPGAVAVAANTLTTIVTGVLGWETVTNPTAAEEGTDEESDTAARTRRRNTLALQGVTLPEAATSGLNVVPGVRSSVFRENVTASPVTIEGVTLGPHSVYACVDGGTDTDIATVLLRKKSAGAGWNGTTTVDITETHSGQVYHVKFSRPEIVQIFVQVTVAGGAAYPDVPKLVRDAMLAYAAGEQDQQPGFVVGGDVSPFELAAAVNAAAPPLYVKDCKLSLDGVTFTAADIPITIAQKADLLYGNIAVTVIT